MRQSKIKVTARENSLPAENEFQKTDGRHGSLEMLHSVKNNLN